MTNGGVASSFPAGRRRGAGPRSPSSCGGRSAASRSSAACGTEVVAERLFDEMERALSDLLAREEARPVEAYGAAGAVPLAPAPAQPFVVGCFEVDPDGACRCGRRERTRRLAERASRSRSGVGHRPERLHRLRVGQRPGTAPNDRRIGPRRDAGPADDEKKAKAVSAYDALRSRSTRPSSNAPRGRRRWRDEYAAKEQARRLRRARAKDGCRAQRRRRTTASAPSGSATAAARAVPPPMVGEVVDPQHLLLYRTVLRDGGAYRQGLLLDVPRLGDLAAHSGAGEVRDLADFDDRRLRDHRRPSSRRRAGRRVRLPSIASPSRSST